MAYQTKTARKPKSRHRFSSRVAAIIIGVLVVAGGVFAFLYFVRPFEQKAEGNNEIISRSSDDVGKSSGSAEPLGKESKSKQEERESEKGTLNYDSSSLEDLEELSGIINYAGISEGKFLINATIYQQFGDDGTCEISLVGPTGRKLGGTVATEAGPASTFCSYSIPNSGIESGKWQITVYVQHNDESGTLKTEVEL
ncbi:hypothetical protein IJG79_00590 [Candidatus Saccharibacteria bacterium]|nr:hypothetical protein [Candidatus Saccharibacteria bacterium]